MSDEPIEGEEVDEEVEDTAPTGPPPGYVPVPPGTDVDVNGNPLVTPGTQEEIAGLPETEPAPAIAEADAQRQDQDQDYEEQQGELTE